MAVKALQYKQEIFNQLINLFWTILGFTPILWFWIKEGINVYFYLFLIAALITGILPEKILNLFMLSSRRSFYERLGVKHIRKFVQNGDAVRAVTNKQGRLMIRGVTQAKKYLKTIAMYERFHWACFTFFLLTAVLCFFYGYWILGLAITATNILYNLCSILLQQYNKARVKKIIG